MKKSVKRFVSVLACVCLLFAAVPATLLMESLSITVSAAYDVGPYLKKDASWYSSDEAIAVADEIVQYQLAEGGWRKDMTNTSVTGSWAKSTIDNNTTWGQVRLLAKVYNATGTEKYKTSCLKGFDLLIKMQYDNGGWPQIYGDDGTYHAHITYNDTAMVSVLNIMLEAADKSGDFTFLDGTRQQQAQNALDKGVECILNTQIEANGTLTAWCQQHDEFTLEPTSARAYELPSISSSESAGIVDFLRSLPNPDARIIRSINAAVRWFDAVKIENIKFDWNSDGTDKVVTTVEGSTLWARFYEIGTNRPMFSDRDGLVYYDVADISQERRTGYAWYGTWPAKNVALGTLPETVTSISGILIETLTPDVNALPDLWSIDTSLQVGDLVFGDRDVTYATLPDSLVGAEYIVTPCDAKSITTDLATFTAGGDITVYIAIDARTITNYGVPSWMSSWTNTGLTAINNKDVTFNLYAKDVSSGTTVTLGQNGGSSGCVNYAVMAVEQEVEEQGVWGDANGDGIVDAIDGTMVTRAAVGRLTLSDSVAKWCDVNGDGYVDAIDATMVIRRAVGVLKVFPVE